MSNIAIQVDSLWKEYRLGALSHHTIARDLQSWWARLRGMEDPNKPVDTGISPLSVQLSHSDDRFWALQDVSFEVKQGEIIGIIGRNGAGKSTLLKILSQVTAPTKGAVGFNGRIASLLEVGTGFHPELTGRENVFLNGAILGMSKADIRNKFDEIVAFAEVDKFIDTPVKRYSSGMYVRLAFAVAAHLEPEILIVDEVLAVGDAAFQKKCLEKIEEVGNHGQTVLFVSHNLASVRKLCQRAILLGDGSVMDDGYSNAVIERYLAKNITSSDMQMAISLLPEHPVIQILDAKIDQPGSQPNEWVTGRPIEIGVQYLIKKQAANLRVFFDLLDNQDNLIFRSFHDCDYGSVTLLAPGTYRSNTLIPGDLLAPQKYVIRIGATIFGSHSCTGDHLVFPFQLYKNGRVNRAYAEEVYLGLIAPLIAWKTHQEEEVSSGRID